MWLWGDKLHYFTREVAKRKDYLFNYMLFLRVTPTLPNTFINVCSPIVNIPYPIFIGATVVGLVPATFVTVRAGVALNTLSSFRELYDFKTVAAFFCIGLVAVVPTILNRSQLHDSEKPHSSWLVLSFMRICHLWHANPASASNIRRVTTSLILVYPVYKVIFTYDFSWASIFGNRQGSGLFCSISLVFWRICFLWKTLNILLFSHSLQCFFSEPIQQIWIPYINIDCDNILLIEEMLVRPCKVWFHKSRLL